MKLSSAQKSFLTDLAYPTCHELFLSRTESNLSPQNSDKAAINLFENCLESFDLSLIPPCSSLIPAFINYYQSQIKKLAPQD